MKKFIFLLWLFATPVLAADGDACNPAFVKQLAADAIGGGMDRVFCRVMTDTRTTAGAGGPVTFDLDSLGNLPGLPKGTLPSALAFKLVLNDCTAGTMEVMHSEINGGFEHQFKGAPTIGLAAAAPSWFVVEPPFGSVLNARWASVAGCTNGWSTYVLGYVK